MSMGAIGSILRQMCERGQGPAGLCDKIGGGSSGQVRRTTQPVRTTAPVGTSNPVPPQIPGGSGGGRQPFQLTDKGISPWEALQSDDYGRYNTPSDPAFWFTYGMGPEFSFFTDNTAPTPAAPGTGQPTRPGGPQRPGGKLATGAIQQALANATPRQGVAQLRASNLRMNRGGPLSVLRSLIR